MSAQTSIKVNYPENDFYEAYGRIWPPFILVNTPLIFIPFPPILKFKADVIKLNL